MKTKKTASASEWTTGLRLLGFMSVFRVGAYSASARTSLPTLLWTTYNGNGGTRLDWPLTPTSRTCVCLKCGYSYMSNGAPSDARGGRRVYENLVHEHVHV